MSKLTKKKLIKHLNKSDKEDIIREVIILFDTFKNVKEYYTAELTDDKNPLLEKYKKKITKAYLLKNPKERTTNININKLINEFKKISIYTREIVDLMLHRTECGIAAFNRNNKRSITFYNCILTTFKEAILLIVSDDSLDEFQERIDRILETSKAGKFEIQKKLTDVAELIH